MSMGNGVLAATGEEGSVSTTAEQTGLLHSEETESSGMTAEQVQQLYQALIQAADAEEFDRLLEELDGSSRESFASALTQQQRQELERASRAFDAHQPEPEGTQPPEDREVLHPSRNVTDAAPFLPPVTGIGDTEEDGRAMLEKPDSGIRTEKHVSHPDANGRYTLTLEAWVTGKQTIIHQQTQIPTDIILVLDQSGSMDREFASYTYTPFTGTPEELYRRRKNLYVKRTDGAYAPVTAVKEKLPAGTYVPYSGHTNRRYAAESGAFFHRCADGTYGAVYVTQFLGEYSYACQACGSLGRDFGGRNIPAFSDAFYREEVVEGYRFSYLRSDGTMNEVCVPQNMPAPDWTFYTAEQTSSTSRLEALKTAVARFSDAVAEKARGADAVAGTADDVDHRIAMVGFASARDSSSGMYRNTEILVGDVQHRYDTVTDAVCAEAFQDMKDPDGLMQIQSSIRSLEAKGATYVDLGVELANRIWQNNPVPVGQKRNRVMIVFTDGQPGASGYDETVAESAIRAAQATKDTYGASVYSVGIFEGADAASAGSEYGSTTEKSNWFMQNISGNNGVVQEPSYYLSAADAHALNNIFQTISDQIQIGGSAIELGKQTVLTDVIGDAFRLPEGADQRDIRVSTADYIGDDSFAQPEEFAADVQISPDGKTITVTDFDYSENWVGTVTEQGHTVYRGRKLVVTIPIQMRQGFLGGNGVPTNGAESGLYTKDGPVAHFEIPSVDLPIPDITVQTKDHNFYLLADASQDALMQGVTIHAGGVDLLKELEPWQTAYAEVTICKGQALTGLTQDQTYTVSARITPKSAGSAVQKIGTGTGKIRVFLPELTFRDSSVFYGAPVPDGFDANHLDTVWRHGESLDQDVTMQGIPPQLELSYRLGAGTQDGIVQTKADIPVQVDVQLSGQQIGEYVHFLHKPCEPDCGFHAEEGNFLLHVQTCCLTIEKQGGKAGEPYVFTVCKDGEPYTELTIIGSDQAVIYELPVGQYTIQEDAKWAWRYTDIRIGTGVCLDSSHPRGCITCVNSGRRTSWLNGFSDVVQNVARLPKGHP